VRHLVSEIARPPARQRSALTPEIQGLSCIDIAGALDATVPAVKRLLVRARIGLAEATSAGGGPSGLVGDGRADLQNRPADESLTFADQRGGGRRSLRVALADDDVLLREGLASLLESSGFEVVGQASNAEELVAIVREHTPELAVVDIRMPPTHTTEGIEAARAIREEFPDAAILVLSAHVEVDEAMDLLATGDRIGYLLKRRVTDVDDFVDTLERVAGGGSVVDPALVSELIAARRADDPLEDLTPREREVLALMAEGRSNSGIARRLWVADGTVEKHVQSILGKLRLPEAEDDHRRVLAVITYLEAR
jgi:DNA-binding NarL/FixJ family response regulator